MNARHKTVDLVEANSWADELNSLLKQTTSFEDRFAIECFKNAMRPYLEDPKRLRTLLGKIAMTNGGGMARMSALSNEQEFETVEEFLHHINDDSVEISLE